MEKMMRVAFLTEFGAAADNGRLTLVIFRELVLFMAGNCFYVGAKQRNRNYS